MFLVNIAQQKNRRYKYQKLPEKPTAVCYLIRLLKCYPDIDSAGDGLDNKLCRAVFADRFELRLAALDGLCGLMYINLRRSGALAVALIAEVELLSRLIKAV